MKAEIMIRAQRANVPNPDCQDADDNMAFWAKHQNGRAYKEIFPRGGRGTKKAVADLANYASNRAAAQLCRARGDISTAEIYERICENIYADLPFIARF